MSEIVTREEFDQYIKTQRKIINKVAEIASSFEDFENLREKKISKDISGLNFDFEAPPSFDAPDLHYVGIYKPEWLSTDTFGVYTRDDEASRSDVVHCYSLPVNMLAMGSIEIANEAERLNKKIEAKRAAARKAVSDNALKNMYKSYLKLKDMFEKMPQERIDEITGAKDEQAGN